MQENAKNNTAKGVGCGGGGGQKREIKFAIFIFYIHRMRIWAG